MCVVNINKNTRSKMRLFAIQFYKWSYYKSSAYASNISSSGGSSGQTAQLTDRDLQWQHMCPMVMESGPCPSLPPQRVHYYIFNAINICFLLLRSLFSYIYLYIHIELFSFCARVAWASPFYGSCIRPFYALFARANWLIFKTSRRRYAFTRNKTASVEENEGNVSKWIKTQI